MLFLFVLQFHVVIISLITAITGKATIAILTSNTNDNNNNNNDNNKIHRIAGFLLDFKKWSSGVTEPLSFWFNFILLFNSAAHEIQQVLQAPLSAGFYNFPLTILEMLDLLFLILLFKISYHLIKNCCYKKIGESTLTGGQPEVSLRCEDLVFFKGVTLKQPWKV